MKIGEPILKVCTQCSTPKPLSEYYTQTHKNGRIQIGSKCKSCVREFQKQYRNTNKDHHNTTTRQRRLINKQKAIKRFGDKCFDCGQTFPSCVYDFHHLDPSAKEISVATAFGKKESHYERELAKCVMLCANCHRIRHHGKEEN